MSPWIGVGVWSDPGVSSAKLLVPTPTSDTLAADAGDVLAGRVTLPFGVRITRPACAAVLPVIDLSATAAVSVPGNAEATVVSKGSPAIPLRLAPLLAPIPDVVHMIVIEQISIPASGSWESGTYTFQVTVSATDPTTRTTTTIATLTSETTVVVE
jgi:hypothetical protein